MVKISGKARRASRRPERRRAQHKLRSSTLRENEPTLLSAFALGVTGTIERRARVGIAYVGNSSAFRVLNRDELLEPAVVVRLDKVNLGDCLSSFVGRRAAAPIEPPAKERLGLFERVALFPRKDSELHAVLARRRNEPEPLGHPRGLPVIVLDVDKRVFNEGLDALAHVSRASRFSATIGCWLKEGNMSLELLAVDLGKRSFHIHGIDIDGMIISRKTSRFKLIETIKELAQQTIAMEACAIARTIGVGAFLLRAIGFS